jgi:Fusaric acid resistance protein-like
MGGSSTLSAMTRFPAAFDGVRCLVSPQPVAPRIIVGRRLALMGLGDRLDDFDTTVRLRTSVGLDQRIPQEWARNARVPTFLYQVRGDILTHPSDVQTMSRAYQEERRLRENPPGSSSAARSPCSTGSMLGMDSRPGFGSIAAVISLGAAYGERRQRAVQLIAGVILGIVLADLLVRAIGYGLAQIGVLVVLAMLAAIILGGSELLVTEAERSRRFWSRRCPPRLRCGCSRC